MVKRYLIPLAFSALDLRLISHPQVILIQETIWRNGVDVPFPLSLPGIGFDNRRPSRHPSVGSLVTVGGKNVHSGLHGEIYEVTIFDDNLELACFSVFLTAKFRCVPIRRQFLSLRQ